MPDLLIFQKGGVVMYGLASLSIYAVAVIIFKVIQFRKANVFDRSFIEPALREIKQGRPRPRYPDAGRYQGPHRTHHARDVRMRRQP